MQKNEKGKQVPLLHVVVTARPSWARVKTIVLEYFKKNGKTKLVVVLIGPAISNRYGDLRSEIPVEIPLITFGTLLDSDELSEISLSCIEGSRNLINYWRNQRPDCVLVVADRTETLGVSVAASLMQIPLIHLQGGEISGSIDDKIRDVNSKLADLHLTTNNLTKQNLEKLGENPRIIFPIGCPSIDLVEFALKHQESFLKKQASALGGVGSDFSLVQDYGLIMFHPDTLNIDDSLVWVQAIINMINTSKLNWIWFWPNPDHGTSIISKTIRKEREFGNLQNVHFVINLSPEIFINAASKSLVLIGNSSFGIRESSYLGLRVLNLGNRQQNRQRGENVVDVKSPQNLIQSLHEILERKFEPSSIYGDGNAANRAVEIISNWSPVIKSRKPI